ncbi:MAG: hypothetical protein KGI00_01905 [Candidatus Micrarchaeota archaeon]|nr:hypothetical protein [Candidatus Micrarchaeota archaeon]
MPIEIVRQKADYVQAQAIARANGGRLITLQEAMRLARTDPKLFSRLESGQFYLGDGKGTAMDGHYRIDYEKEAFAKVAKEEWQRLPFNGRACARGGDRPLSLFVHRPYYSDARMYLYADDWPESIVPIVVVAQQTNPNLSPAGINPKLISSSLSAIAELEAAERDGRLKPGLTYPLKELLRSVNP